MRTVFLLSLFAGFAFLSAGIAAPLRQVKDDAKKDETKSTELHLLEKNAGARFGDWNVWRFDEGDKAIFLINAKTGLAIYLPWSSNGWINYRIKGGEWHVLFTKGEPEKQNRDDLKIAPFLDKKTEVTLQNGKYTFKEWSVRVTKDLIDFHNTTHDDRMTIRRNSGEVVHNGRTVGGKN